MGVGRLKRKVQLNRTARSQRLPQVDTVLKPFESRYERALEHFLQHCKQADRIMGYIKAYLEAIRRLSGASADLGASLHDYYMMRSHVQSGQSLPQADAACVKECLSAPDNDGRAKMDSNYLNKVFGRWNSYVNLLHVLKEKTSERDTKLNEYSWYLTKIELMKDDSSDRYQKNLGKLEASRQAFETANTSLIHDFSTLLAHAPETLNAVMHEIAEAGVLFFSAGHRGNETLQSQLKKSRTFDVDLSALKFTDFASKYEVGEQDITTAWKQLRTGSTHNNYLVETTPSTARKHSIWERRSTIVPGLSVFNSFAQRDRGGGQADLTPGNSISPSYTVSPPHRLSSSISVGSMGSLNLPPTVDPPSPQNRTVASSTTPPLSLPPRPNSSVAPVAPKRPSLNPPPPSPPRKPNANPNLLEVPTDEAMAQDGADETDEGRPLERVETIQSDSSLTAPVFQKTATNRRLSAADAPVLFQVRAIYDYQALKDDELSFAIDDILLIFSGEDNWWEARLEGTALRGWIPSNFVEKMDS